MIEESLLNLMQSQLNLVQQSIDKYDNFSQSIRNWTVTLWAATISAGSIQGIEIKPWWALIVVSILIVFAMGMYDGIYKTYRENYKKIRKNIATQVRNNTYNLSSVSFPEQPEGFQLLKKAIKSFSRPHVCFVYVLLIIISVVILIFRLNENLTIFYDTINNQAYAAWILNLLTLILVILAYIQLNKLNNQIREWRTKEAIKKHISDLKGLFNGWKSNLPSVPLAEELYFAKNMPDFESRLRGIALNKIEQNPLFEDFKNCHLPKGYETLPGDWEKYKKLLEEYFNEYNDIADRIKNEIPEEFSAKSVYSKAVISLKGGERWGYYTELLPENQYKKLMYGIQAQSSYTLLKKGTDEEIKKYQEQHEACSDKIKSKHEAELKKLIKKEKELSEQRISLAKVLENLEIYPDFPNTDCCEIIKQSFHK